MGLSCDDTKVTSGLRLYWDQSQKTYVLIGSTNGPLEVADPESVQQIMDDGDIPKGTKVITLSLIDHFTDFKD